MNKQIFITTIVLGALGILTTVAPQAQAQNSARLGLEEDEALVCILDLSTEVKGDEVCKVVHILDLLDENHQEKLFGEFNQNSDTFPIEALD